MSNDCLLPTANNGAMVAAGSATDDFIKSRIFTIRGVQVMLDRDLAVLYGVETGALNRQVKRNGERFPNDFMFRLSSEEWSNLKCQIGTSSWGGDRQIPHAFTENGVAMLSGVPDPRRRRTLPPRCVLEGSRPQILRSNEDGFDVHPVDHAEGLKKRLDKEFPS